MTGTWGVPERATVVCQIERPVAGARVTAVEAWLTRRCVPLLPAGVEVLQLYQMDAARERLETFIFADAAVVGDTAVVQQIKAGQVLVVGGVRYAIVGARFFERRMYRSVSGFVHLIVEVQRVEH
jgi:hypothetical protein